MQTEERLAPSELSAAERAVQLAVAQDRSGLIGVLQGLHVNISVPVDDSGLDDRNFRQGLPSFNFIPMDYCVPRTIVGAQYGSNSGTTRQNRGASNKRLLVGEVTWRRQVILPNFRN